MSFRQVSGPPASRRQLDRLLALLREAGHVDFRDARHPMGFTQRQAGGKFTRDEADEFIDTLESAAHEAEVGSSVPAEAGSASVPASPSPASRAPRPSDRSTDRALRDIASDRLAAELQRRGWAVIEPLDS